MKTILLLSGVLILLAFSNSCVYNNEEELYPVVEPPDSVDVCGHPEVISFSQDIVPLVDAKCDGCHTAQRNNGNVTLEGHINYLKVVDDGSLLGSIKYEAGFEPMPKSEPRLSECDVLIFQKWIDNGAPNN